MYENQTFIGFIINIVRYKDFDAIISCLTENGILSLYSRGLFRPKSKLSSSCELGNLCEFEIIKSNTFDGIIKGVKVKFSIPEKMSKSLFDVFALLEISKFTLQIHPESSLLVFDGIKNTFEILSVNLTHKHLTISKFITDIIFDIGYRVGYENVNPELAGFNYDLQIYDNNVACKLVNSNIGFSLNELKVMRFLENCQFADIINITQNTINSKKIFDFVLGWWEHIFEHKVNSYKLYEQKL